MLLLVPRRDFLMTTEVIFAVLILTPVAIWAWRRQRRQARIERYGRRTERIYVRKRTNGWLKTLLPESTSRRTTYKRNNQSQKRPDQTL